MTLEYAVDLLSTLLQTGLILVTPILGTAIGIGVSISLIQSITSIQEQTLTFVPKLVAVSMMIVFSAHFMLTKMTEYAVSIFEKIPQMAP
jgi:flagellar biosynthetic protein FliQ|tara:strand:+ start:315 stop:584 length:270 start_codon:yes stop_codon:yes gene_type:complete